MKFNYGSGNSSIIIYYKIYKEITKSKTNLEELILFCIYILFSYILYLIRKFK